jgi:hypothetical protein
VERTGMTRNRLLNNVPQNLQEIQFGGRHTRFWGAIAGASAAAALMLHLCRVAPHRCSEQGFSYNAPLVSSRNLERNGFWGHSYDTGCSKQCLCSVPNPPHRRMHKSDSACPAGDWVSDPIGKKKVAGGGGLLHLQLFTHSIVKPQP